MKKLFILLLATVFLPCISLADQMGSATGGTAGTLSALDGCIYNVTPPSLLNKQQVGEQCDASGNLLVNLNASLPPGTNGIGTITALSASKFTEAQISFSSSGNNAIVAGASDKTTKLYRLTLSCQGATNITIQDGSTAKMGPYYLGAGGSLVLPFDPSGSPWEVGTANTALNLNSSAAVNCGGSVSSIQS